MRRYLIGLWLLLILFLASIGDFNLPGMPWDIEAKPEAKYFYPDIAYDATECGATPITKMAMKYQSRGIKND